MPKCLDTGANELFVEKYVWLQLSCLSETNEDNHNEPMHITSFLYETQKLHNMKIFSLSKNLKIKWKLNRTADP